MFVAAPVWATPIYGPWTYAVPIDTILAYEALPTASDAEEWAWAKGVLTYFNYPVVGLSYYKPAEGSLGQVVAPKPTILNLFDPTFPWKYALVKVDGPNDYSYLFMDTGDGLLTTPPVNTSPYNMESTSNPSGPFGISHVSWISEEEGTPGPEPAILFLLGLGLAGVAGLSRRKR
jgi:hypothetical protein